MFIKKHGKGKRLEVLEEPSYADSLLNSSLADDIKVLGTPWNTSRDTFGFTIQHLLHNIRPEHITKRTFLQFSASVLEPLSILSPALLLLKVMFQKLYKEGKDWDKKLPGELSAKFQQWLSKATKVLNIEIERCYTKNKKTKEILLVGFCDASKIGYAACIYFCAKYTDESRSVKMIAAKTRVAPLTNQSIPRLEILGALILSRMMKTVKRASQQFKTINSEVSFTDSLVFLTPLKNLSTIPGKFQWNSTGVMENYWKMTGTNGSSRIPLKFRWNSGSS